MVLECETFTYRRADRRTDGVGRQVIRKSHLTFGSGELKYHLSRRVLYFWSQYMKKKSETNLSSASLNCLAFACTALFAIIRSPYAISMHLLLNLMKAQNGSFHYHHSVQYDLLTSTSQIWILATCTYPSFLDSDSPPCPTIFVFKNCYSFSALSKYREHLSRILSFAFSLWASSEKILHYFSIFIHLFNDFHPTV